jgi:hypothetical protein
MKTNIILIYLLFIFGACTSINDKNKTSKIENENKSSSLIKIDERLANIDSVVFVFYKDPHGADSLRYTRYYTQYNNIDSATVSTVKMQLNGNIEKLDKIKNCRSEGKIWCFSKQNIIQTIYFSSLNAKCNFLYIIKDGAFYFTNIEAEFSKQLLEIKTKAKEPIL